MDKRQIGSAIIPGVIKIYLHSDELVDRGIVKAEKRHCQSMEHTCGRESVCIIELPGCQKRVRLVLGIHGR